MRDIKIELAEKLKAFSELVTPEDRKDAEIEIPISRPTLDKYLAGDIVKLDTATDLIQFFSGRLKERVELIKDSNLI